MCPTEKFAEKYLSPFKVLGHPGTHSYLINLPTYLRSIHPVFHVSQLEPFTPNTIPNRSQDPPPPVIVDGKEYYHISEILNAKVDRRRRKCPLLYYVRWEGYEGTDEEFGWVLADELEEDKTLLEFHAKYPHKPGPLSHLNL